MRTVGTPTRIFPPWDVESPDLAAGLPLILTLEDPADMLSGGPIQTSLSPFLAAGMLLFLHLENP